MATPAEERQTTGYALGFAEGVMKAREDEDRRRAESAENQQALLSALVPIIDRYLQPSRPGGDYQIVPSVSSEPP